MIKGRQNALAVLAATRAACTGFLQFPDLVPIKLDLEGVQDPRGLRRLPADDRVPMSPYGTGS